MKIVFATVLIVISVAARAQQLKLSLHDAVGLAAAGNPEIISGRKEIEKAQQQRVLARSLFLPSIAANASVNHFFQLTPFFGFGETPNSNAVPYGRFGGADQLGASVSFWQPLFNPAGRPAMRRARLTENESAAAKRIKETGIFSEVKLSYLQLLVLKQRIALQQESIQRNQQALKFSAALLVQGKGLRVDTLRAFTAVKNLEPELIRLTYAEQTEHLHLKALLGVDSAVTLVLTDSLRFPDPSEVPSENEIYETAVRTNPEFLSYGIREQLAAQQKQQAGAARLPVVSLTGQYQVQSQTRHFDYGSGYYPTSSFAGIQVSVPLFTGFSTPAKIRQADLAHEQSVLEQKNAYALLRAATHKAVADHVESLARLKTSATVKETANLSYTIVQYRYAKGVSSRLELTDAELALSTAQSNYLVAVYDYLAAQVAIHRLMGADE